MGVSQLWPILQPCARPTKLETLNKKRLAVDASIWIYQFLKAVRDKEGNALRNSHVVGFFRRICKLLFFGIKPVFVFDGGAPALKRQTILGRKRRREGRRDDAARTAGKLLAVQMQKHIEEQEQKRKRQIEVRGQAVEPDVEEEIPENLVYVDELGMSNQERQQTRKFVKKDAYHLPEIDGGLESMGQPGDPRIMSAEELEEYARQFHNGEDINLYDFSKIDFDGDFFKSLPAADRYNILNAARLRSRLRMGLSKEQLEGMFPDRMAFSRFQIDRVRERNELTQRLMNLNGMSSIDEMLGIGVGRIAGDKEREYILVKNEGAEGGWALGVVDKRQGEREKPIDVDELPPRRDFNAEIEEQWEDEDEFEDIPIEGLNRLPKTQRRELNGNSHSGSSRPAYKSRSAEDLDQRAINREIDTLFVEEDGDGTGEVHSELFLEDSENEEEDLDRAIAMSLQQPESPAADPEDSEEEHIRQAIALSMQKQHGGGSGSEDDQMDFEDVPMPVYEQKAVEKAKPIPKSSGQMVAHIVNNRANAAVPKRKAVDITSDDEDDMDLQTALAMSRKETSKRKRPAPVPSNVKNPFDGPLPFEKLAFQPSLFRKEGKKASKEDSQNEGEEIDDLAGGFEPELDVEASKPLPPWLAGAGDIRSDVKEQNEMDRALDAEDRERALEERRIYEKEHGVIEVPSDDEGSDVEFVDVRAKHKETIDLTTDVREPVKTPEREDETVEREDTTVEQEDEMVTAAELAEEVRAIPPQSELPDNRRPSPEPVQLEAEDSLVNEQASEEEFVEWSESDHEELPKSKPDASQTLESDTSVVEEDHAEAGPEAPPQVSKSPTPVLEDVSLPAAPAEAFVQAPVVDPFASDVPNNDIVDNEQEILVSDADFDDFSDPDDEELLAQLAIEAEEHARFASTLNNKSESENREAYERELKQLRNQQKKDRRDADEVSHIMITECQALLRLFGLPYITAPMEAEAQCAELVSLGLVDGIVTDDSDIFLFGGTRVYKNMFNSNKFVECYLSTDLEKELSLSREQLIAIAHLLGSDYTEGLPGIGPVQALEIVSEFPTSNGLEEFKAWWADVQLNNRPKEADASSPFRKKFRRSQATKLFLPPGFPSPAVTEAYLKPDVDNNPEPFQWGVPDLDNLRNFLMATIGWTQERTDEVLVPVIKDMNRREAEGTQSNITRFFEGGVGTGARSTEGFAPRVRNGGSIRMKEAVKRLKARKESAIERGATFGEEAAEWARRNELSEEAHQAKQRAKEKAREERKKAKNGKGKGKKTVTFEEEESAAGNADAEDENDDDDCGDDYRDTASKGKSRAGRKRGKVSA